jgi:hypothetical protein
MAKKIKCLTVLIIALTLTQCVSPSKLMQSWVGSSKAQLYQSWGPPTRVTEDGQGGEILIYESYVNMGQQPGQVYTNYDGSIGYKSPQQRGYARTRMFYVNRDGVIYSWRWQGY